MENLPVSPPTVPRRILVRGTNWLGDAVMTTPALLRLREKFPDAHIALLTPDKLAQLWEHHPAINESICVALDESVFAVAKKLRAEKFDTALVLPNSPRSVIEVSVARIPRRLGYARPWRSALLTQIVPSSADAVKMHKRSATEIEALVREETGDPKPKIPESAHQSHEYLHLAAALGANPEPLPGKLFVTPEEIEATAKKFRLEQISNPVLGLNPGAEYGPAKRWPMERFVAAAKEIQQRTKCAWILFGGKNDVDLTSRIQSAIGGSPSAVLNLAGQTSLRELMCLIKLCRVFLTNDTGPMHVAAALGVPVVAVFGSTSPELTGPISSAEVRHQILTSKAPCSPCFLRECPIDFRCMNGISVERVVEAVVKSTQM
jgi:heptosyltransferase-2